MCVCVRETYRSGCDPWKPHTHSGRQGSAAWPSALRCLPLPGHNHRHKERESGPTLCPHTYRERDIERDRERENRLRALGATHPFGAAGQRCMALSAAVPALLRISFGFRILGFGFQVSGFGFRVLAAVPPSSYLYPHLSAPVRGGEAAVHGPQRCGAPPSSHLYRGISLIRKRRPLGPYSSPMPRALWWYGGGGRFLMSSALRCLSLSTSLTTHP